MTLHDAAQSWWPWQYQNQRAPGYTWPHATILRAWRLVALTIVLLIKSKQQAGYDFTRQTDRDAQLTLPWDELIKNIIPL